MSPNRRVHRTAFTLIELMVVVAIVSLLIAILLPSLARAREQSRMRVCQSNMRQLATAWLTYASEWRGFLPGQHQDFYIVGGKIERLCWLGTYKSGGGKDPNNVPIKGTIYRYMGEQTKAYKCPVDAVDPNTAVKNLVKPLYSYTSPTLLTGAPLEMLNRTTWVSNPDATFDWDDWNNGVLKTNRSSLPWMLTEEDEDESLASVDDSAWGNQDRITTRHMGMGGIAHTDGHVSMEKFKNTTPNPFDAWKAYYELSDGRYFNLGPWWVNSAKYFTFGYIKVKPNVCEVPPK